MVDGEREFEPFLDELYAASVEQARLSAALRQFAFAFDADEACLLSIDRAPDRDHVTIVERSGGTSVSGLLLTQELAVRMAAGRDSLWRGSLRGSAADPKAAPAHYMAIIPRTDGEAAAGFVALRDLPFTDAEVASARALLPDIRRATSLRRNAGRAEALGLGVHLFDRNPVAIFITRQRAVERSNAAALSILALGGTVESVSGKLRFEDARVQAAFELLSRPDANGSASRAFAFLVEGADGGKWIAQLSSSLPGGVIVALTRFDGASQARETMLNGFTDLTPAERTIFAAFVDGHDIADIALRLNRSVETVRWHVRNLFTKLGVNSQADLARLGALLLPI